MSENGDTTKLSPGQHKGPRTDMVTAIALGEKVGQHRQELEGMTLEDMTSFLSNKLGSEINSHSVRKAAKHYKVKIAPKKRVYSKKRKAASVRKMGKADLSERVVAIVETLNTLVNKSVDRNGDYICELPDILIQDICPDYEEKLGYVQEMIAKPDLLRLPLAERVEVAQRLYEYAGCIGVFHQWQAYAMRAKNVVTEICKSFTYTLDQINDLGIDVILETLESRFVSKGGAPEPGSPKPPNLFN